MFDSDSHDQLKLPYSILSPVTHTERDFDSVDDIFDEIKLISEQADGKRTLGQELFYLVPLFANPQYVIHDDHFALINEYHFIQDYNIPLGESLNKTDAHKLEYFTIIKNELGAALRHKQEKDGRSKS